MFVIACIFFEYDNFPYLEAIKFNIIPENTINAHLSRPMPYFLHF
jgi:hypothetical protein